MSKYARLQKAGKIPQPRKVEGYVGTVTDVRDMQGLPPVGGDTSIVLALDAPPIYPGMNIGGWDLPFGYKFPTIRIPLAVSRHAGPGNNFASFKPDSTPEDRTAWMHDMDIDLTKLIVDPVKRKRAQAVADMNYERRQGKPDRSWKHWLTSKVFRTGLQNVYYDSFTDAQDPTAVKRARIPTVQRLRGDSKRYKSTNARDL